MITETARSFYDRKRKQYENLCPTCRDGKWLRQEQLEAKELRRLGMKGVKPGLENQACTAFKGFSDMRWQSVETNEDIFFADAGTLRKLDDDGNDMHRLVDHSGWYCDPPFNEEMAMAVVMKVRIPRRVARREDVHHPKSRTSFLRSKTRVRYAWGFAIKGSAGSALLGRTVAPGMLSAANWGDSMAKTWALECTNAYAADERRKRIEELQEMIEYKKESIRHLHKLLRDNDNQRISMEKELEKLQEEG